MPARKKRKVVYKGFRPEFLKLPPHILEMICRYSDFETKKALTATCKTFHELCVLPVLLLDFDRIQKESCRNVFPLVHCAYETVRLTGKRVQGKSEEFRNALQSSRYTVKTLFIGKTCKQSDIAFSRLQFLLGFFPNLTAVEIVGVAIEGGRGRAKVLDLRKLKKLRLELVDEDVLTAFGSVRNLEDFLFLGFRRRFCGKLLKKFVQSQTALESLVLCSCTHKGDINFSDAQPMCNLKTIKTCLILNFFELAPNLEHLEVRLHGQYQEIREYLSSRKSLTLKTLILSGYYRSEGNIEEFRPNFPMLEN